MDAVDLERAEQLMRGNDGVLIVEGETIWYRIAGRSITAVVEIPAKPPVEENAVVRVRLNTATRPLQIEALDEDRAPLVKTLNNLYGRYMQLGLTSDEALERIKALDIGFTLEIVNG